VLTLFVVAAAIYVAECLYWVESEAIVLTGARPGRWRARVGPLVALGRKGGVVLAPLLPPLATLADWPALSGVEGAGRTDRAPLSRKALETAKKRVELFIDAAEPVWISCNALWLFLFCITPAVVVARGIAASWIALLVVGLALLAFTLLGFWQAHRDLYPDAAPERRSKTLLMALSPLGAIRAVDHLSRRLFRDTHPLVAAQALCRTEDAVNLARLVYYAPRERDREVREFLEACKLWDRVAAPPRDLDSATIAYCPRCHTQYVRSLAACADCGGVALQRPAPELRTPAPIS
jgi:hypothetical protein